MSNAYFALDWRVVYDFGDDLSWTENLYDYVSTEEL